MLQPDQTPPGQTLVVQPGAAESYWQPVPANGHIDVIFAPHLVAMDCPIGFGTQTVSVGGHVREHAHDRNEEVIYVIKGAGHAVIDGEAHPMTPGSAFFIGKNRRHMFINKGPEDLIFTWLMVPNGLEEFFRLIGRPRRPGEPTPDRFRVPPMSWRSSGVRFRAATCRPASAHLRKPPPCVSPE